MITCRLQESGPYLNNTFQTRWWDNAPAPLSAQPAPCAFAESRSLCLSYLLHLRVHLLPTPTFSPCLGRPLSVPQQPAWRSTSACSWP
jgi:hypothetical protein